MSTILSFIVLINSCCLTFNPPLYPMRPASSLIVLLFNSIGHQLLLRALRTDDVLRVGDEPLSHERRLAGRAAEAVVVPVPALERDEAGAADA